MKKIYILLSLIFTLLFVGNAWAFTVPTPTGYLNDQANKLSVSDKISLERKLRKIEENSSNEVSILILKSLEGEAIEDVSYQVFNTWGLGKKGLDNGVLLVISVNDRKMRIETGKGAGSDLTDLQTQDIQRDMKPFLRKNDFAGACNLATDKIAAALESRKGQKADPGKGAQFNQPLPVSTGEASTTSPPHPPSCSMGVGTYGFGMATAVILFLLTFYFVLRRLFASKPKMHRPAYSYTSSYSSSIPEEVVPPTQRSYHAQSVRHTVKTPHYEPEEDDEDTLPNVLETLAPAVLAPTLKTVVDSWKSSSNEESTSLGNDYANDDTDPSGFGGGESGGGGSSYSWDDDDDDDDNSSSSNDSDDSSSDSSDDPDSW